MTGIEKAIDHFVYGITHDIFRDPVTTHARLAVAALREKAERENGCEYCMGSKMNYSPVNEMFFDVDEIVARVTMTAKILFCPMCGKRLEVEHI